MRDLVYFFIGAGACAVFILAGITDKAYEPFPLALGILIGSCICLVTLGVYSLGKRAGSKLANVDRSTNGQAG